MRWTKQNIADYAAYQERAAELDKRIANGESITEIMEAEQLERGKAAIARIIAQDKADSE